MVMIVQGDTNLFNAMVYGQERHPGTMQYLQNQVNQFTGALTEFGQAFMSGAQNLYDQFNSSEAMRMARAAIRRFDSMFLPDRIQTLNSLGHLQNAPVTMQRWIMANPDIRRLSLGQRIDGYSDTYTDVWPHDGPGKDHYDYRRMTDGVLLEVYDEEKGLDGHIAHVWLDDKIEGDVHLTMVDKVDAMNSGELAAAYAELGDEDPTDKYGNKM
jgi:hypothetical protein